MARGIEWVDTVTHSWIESVYPLQQITVHLQGTRHTDRAALIDRLEAVLVRLREGDTVGEKYDDDVGYRFVVDHASPGPSFFDSPSGRK